MSYWTVPRAWDGMTVAVLASGPSLTPEDAAAVAHLPRIVTNATFRMVPDAQIIYGSDVMFWRHEEYADVFQCRGMRVCVEQTRGVYPGSLPRGVAVLRSGGFEGFSEKQDTICTGGNSGYAAMNLAALTGARQIIVLGLDMTGLHWHGRHPKGLNNPKEHRFATWAKRFDVLARELQKRDIEVLNCSPVTTLQCFPRKSLRSVLH